MYLSDRSTTSLAAGATAAAFLFLFTLIITDARAEPGAKGNSPDIFAGLPQPGGSSRALPAFPPQIEKGDDIAALEAIEIALTQAGDGATYVWRHGNGRLIGSVRPTATFRDAERRMCRHIEMEVRAGAHVRRTEGIACRAKDGVWDLEG